MPALGIPTVRLLRSTVKNGLFLDSPLQIEGMRPLGQAIATLKLRYPLDIAERETRQMTIRKYAKQWLEVNHPSDVSNTLRASKHYPEKDIWFFTFPASYFDPARAGNLNVLLQFKDDPSQFHFLKVPFSFFTDNQSRFDVRAKGDKFDLHISAKQKNWLICERSSGISFCEFEQGSLTVTC